MESYLKENVDIQCLKTDILNTGVKIILYRWKDTAIEINKDKASDIYDLFKIYNELSTEELEANNSSRVIMFIESVLQNMSSSEKEKLIRIEILHCIKNK